MTKMTVRLVIVSNEFEPSNRMPMDRRVFVKSLPSFLIVGFGGCGGSSATSSSGASSGNGSGAGTTNGYDGVIAVSSSGRLVNGAGQPIMLRGVNLAGLQDQSIAGFHPTDPWGAQNSAGEPNWIALSQWKVNAVRIPLNAQSFQGITSYGLTWGGSLAASSWSSTTFNPDPSGNYKATILAAIQQARAYGMYIILDCHICAPQFTLGGTTRYLTAIDQPPFLDAQNGLSFWTSSNPSLGLVAWLQANAVNPATGNINDILFELFNEPYLSNQAFTLTTLQGGVPPTTPGSSWTPGTEYVMLNGGYCNWFYQQGTYNNGRGIPSSFQSPAGSPNALSLSWQVAGYQQVLTGIRTLGASNVCIVNGAGFASSQMTLQYYIPTDTLSPAQIATGWHAYPKSSYPAPAGTYPASLDVGDGTSAVFKWPQDNIAGTNGAGPLPVLITETADASGTSVTEYYMNTMQSWVDSQPLGGAHIFPWEWNGPANYGTTGPLRITEAIYGAPYAFTGGISDGGGVRAGNVLTVTAISGTPLQAGMTLTSGAFYGTYIVKQTGGTPGGKGTYAVMNATNTGQYVAAGNSFTAAAVLPFNGQGLTNYNWMVNHS